jgi:hypothetical protein
VMSRFGFSTRRELREVFGDDPRTPSFIETVGRRGYCFRREPAGPAVAAPSFVGRTAELARLHGLLERCLSPGPNGVLDSTPAGDDVIDFVTKILPELPLHCDGAAVTPNLVCQRDSDCQDATHAGMRAGNADPWAMIGAPRSAVTALRSVDSATGPRGSRGRCATQTTIAAARPPPLAAAPPCTPRAHASSPRC